MTSPACWFHPQHNSRPGCFSTVKRPVRCRCGLLVCPNLGRWRMLSKQTIAKVNARQQLSARMIKKCSGVTNNLQSIHKKSTQLAHQATVRHRSKAATQEGYAFVCTNYMTLSTLCFLNHMHRGRTVPQGVPLRHQQDGHRK